MTTTRIRILVVDDDPGVLSTLTANLELEGFSVTGASSAVAALDASTKYGPFDLVITDMRMPEMNGAQLIRKLRVLQPGIPVILMTAFLESSAVAEVVREGVFTVVTKPFEVEALTRIVQRAAKRPFVLVVDDARAAGSSVAMSLDGIGLRARAVQSAGEAILVLGLDGVDVCVVDADLAGNDGGSLTAEIRKKNPDISVIAVSEPGSADQITRAAAGGAFGCLEKPFDVSALAGLIARARGADAI